MQQISVCRVQLGHLETGGQGAFGTGHEPLDHRADFIARHGGGLRVVGGKRDGTGSHHRPSAIGNRNRAGAFPRALGAGLATGMCQLNAGHRAVVVNEIGDAAQCRHLLVAPDTKASWRDAPLGHHTGGFGEHQCCATGGEPAQMHEVPVVGHSVLGGVLAHGRHANAVAQRELAQGEWRKQSRHGGRY